MKSLKNLTGDSLEQMIDYRVVDQNGDEIGTLHSLWSDPDTGAVEYLGVKTGWLFGHNHVVPAEKAELDEAGNVVRLPYTEAFIKEAPSIAAEAEISEADEQNIFRYYGLGATTEAPYPDPADAGSSLGMSNLAETASLSDATANRLRRTTRPETVPGIDAASVSPDTTRDALPGSTMATYPTANLYGSTGSSSVLADVAAPTTSGSPADTSTDGPAGRGPDMAGGTDLDTYNALAESVSSASGSVSQVTSGTPTTNADPITGEPGAHPVGTGAGALTFGAVGMAIGSVVGGPIGAPIGAAVAGLVGAVGGGYAGKGVAEAVNPTDENTYWQSNYRNAPYYQTDYDFADYEPAYRVGYEGYGRHSVMGRDYSEIEPELESDYMRSRGGSRLGWDNAKAATRDAWERLKAKASR